MSPRNIKKSYRERKTAEHRTRRTAAQRFAFKSAEKSENQTHNLRDNVNHCEICNENFPSEVALKGHTSTSDEHQIRIVYQNNRKDLVNTKLQIQVIGLYTSGEITTELRKEPLFHNAKDETEEHEVLYVLGKGEVTGKLQFTILNCYDEDVLLSNVLKIHKVFEIQSMSEQIKSDCLYIMPCVLPIQLARGTSTMIEVKISMTSVGTNECFVLFKIWKSGQIFFVMKKLYISLESNLTAYVPPQHLTLTPINKKLTKLKCKLVPRKMVELRAPRRKRKCKRRFAQGLKKYPLPLKLTNLVKNGLKPFHGMTQTEKELRKDMLDMIETGVCIENYKDFFSLLLFFELHEMSGEKFKYRLYNVPLQEDPKTSLFILKVPGIAEKRPSVVKNDRLSIIVHGNTDFKYEAEVQKVKGTRVLLKFHDQFRRIFHPDMRVNVRFLLSSWSHDLMQEALEVVVKKGLLPYICFPSQYGIFPIKPVEIRWINRLVQENVQQRLAVKRIVMGTSRPAPYLLFGPPGTGKTVTLVEAILQILETNKEAKILVTAPSNSAVDVFSSRLLKYLSPSQLMRIYSSSREWSEIPEILKDSCCYNSSTGCFEIPGMSEIIKYRVIAVTMVAAGLIKKIIPWKHFSHIFIDECAQALEPEALISVGGFFGSFFSQSPPKILLVLSGDPLQLGPVIHSPFAKKFGLEIKSLVQHMQIQEFKSFCFSEKSLLERLMTSVELYQRDEQNNYNPDVLTKLVKNFRSHPAILDLPNRLFYQGELIPVGDSYVTHSICNWKLLPRKGVPIIFHGVEGKEERYQQSPSYFNTKEIHQVVFYLKEILDSKFRGAKIPESEIGIISPYRRQVEEIRASISKYKIGKDVTVASVEEFQGQERRVIIISTVRSDPQQISSNRTSRLGFLREPKRFNVAVTRAKSLLIIIGNPYILCGDPCWGKLLQYCVERGCYTGVPFKLNEN